MAEMTAKVARAQAAALREQAAGSNLINVQERCERGALALDAIADKADARSGAVRPLT